MYQRKGSLKRKLRQPVFYFCTSIFIACITFHANYAFSIQLSQQQSQEQLTKLKKNIRNINHWLLSANTEKTGLSKQLEKQDKEINNISRVIRLNQAKISKHIVALKQLDKKYQAQNTALKMQKVQLVKQIKTAYLHGKQPELKMLLDTDNPQDLMRQMKYFSYINNARNIQIQRYQSSLDAIFKTKDNILIEQKGLKGNRLSLEKNKNKLMHQRAERKKVLALLGAKIKNSAQRLQKMKMDQQRLEKLLNELETAIANIPLPSDAVPFSQQKNKLPWPSHGKVIAHFGSYVAQNKLRLHGIRVATKENAPVKAIHYGRVIFSNWIRGFGLLTIIDHGGQYMSLYGNNKSLLKEPGDWVRAGEIIAYSSASTTNDESGLYFEIRKNGKPLNPNKWLRN